MPGVQHLTIGPDEAGQRLDRWLRRRFPQLTQGRIEKMCRKGELRIDGARTRAASRIAAGQTVRIPPIPDDAPPPPTAPRPALREADAQMIRAAVIYRDAHILALNKPAGLAVQGGSGQSRHLDALAEALQFDAEEPPRLVHRLDRDTSGVLVMARTRRAAEALAGAFRDRQTRKIYWAAVAGNPSPRMGIIRYGLVKAAGHGRRGEGEKMRCVPPDAIETTPGARRARTDYAVIEALGRLSWVAAMPVTGRTHQIRAHLAGIGHPILGDGKYGGSAQTNEGDGWGAGVGGDLGRGLHLHARGLILSHPVTGARLVLTAPLPPHMAQSWAALGWREADAPLDPFDEEAA